MQVNEKNEPIHKKGEVISIKDEIYLLKRDVFLFETVNPSDLIHIEKYCRIAV